MTINKKKIEVFHKTVILDGIVYYLASDTKGKIQARVDGYHEPGIKSLQIKGVVEKVKVTAIAKQAFESIKYIKNIKCPPHLQYIGDRAFYGCAFLEKIELNKGIKSICDEAFAKCGNLSSVYIPSSIQHIGKNAFPVGTKLFFESSYVTLSSDILTNILDYYFEVDVPYQFEVLSLEKELGEKTHEDIL